MSIRRTPDSFGDADRRLHELAQLRKLWRGFRDPQERLEDERLSRPILDNPQHRPAVQESIAPYGLPAVRAAIRHWWTKGEYAALVKFAEQLEPELLDDEPLIRVYLEEAAARLAEARSR